MVELNLTALEVLLGALLGLSTIVMFLLSYRRAGDANRIALDAQDAALQSADAAGRSATAAEAANSLAAEAKDIAERASNAAERAAEAAERQVALAAQQWRPQIDVAITDISDGQARVRFGTSSQSPIARRARWSMSIEGLDAQHQVFVTESRWIELGRTIDSGESSEVMAYKPTATPSFEDDALVSVSISASFVKMYGGMGQDLTALGFRIDPSTVANPMFVRTRFDMWATGEDGEEVVENRIWCDTQVSWHTEPTRRLNRST